RKLLKARRSGVVSSVEAALFTSQWARAMQIDAVWVLVRPAPRGPGPAISPASYTQGLLAIQYEGELRWQDPTCTVCAPYELRPDMEGASAYAWGLTKTREPTQGLLVATTSGDETTFALEASAALSLRLALQSGMADRSTRAAEWLAENATLTKVDGLGTAGEPVTATVVGGAPAFWPEADPDGSLWMGWVGERRWVGAPTGADALYEGDALTWSRSTSAGVTTETLTIVDRRVPAETLATLREVQSQTTLPEPSVSPEDEAEGAAEGAVEDAPPPATED
ncbi:MAG: hypothetical protein KC912_03905, partial [Proteobacteria bacterium]|nr:hypothetical protein [Pseudomonadota bacterium]